MAYTLTAPHWRNATLALPASKSISNRALIIGALSPQPQPPRNISVCDDTDVLVRALRFRPAMIDIRASGSAMRFLTAFLSITPGEHILTGTDRMQHRPIKVLVEALRQLGADIAYVGQEGFPPLRIRGRQLLGGHIKVAADVSSQYISSLLMIGPVMTRGLTIELVGDVISRSYIDLTLSMMKDYGAAAQWTRVDTIQVLPQRYQPTPYAIESDWSAASYWYELLALTAAPNAALRLEGLMDGSYQGDAAIRYIFSLLGVKTTFAAHALRVPTMVTIRRAAPAVKSLTFDCSNCPDTAQTLVATCCGIGIPFDFTGLSTLRIKETDRLAALQTELRKLGFVLSVHGNSRMTWDGTRCTPSAASIDTYDDHRMAMALAPLVLTQGRLTINHPEVVTKSYPLFWQHLQQTGITITEE